MITSRQKTEVENRDSSNSSDPFTKPQNHFEPATEIKSLASKNHEVQKVKKKFKAGSSDNRNNSFWYVIRTKSVKSSYKDRLNHIIVAVGELFRLLDGTLPKYRIMELENETLPISKEIENATLYRNISNTEYMEGMGRNLMGEIFYYQHDLHEGNCFVDENDYFKVIDHDRCFAPITLLMQDLWPETIDQDVVQQNIERRMPLTLEDYENFPRITTDDYKGLSEGSNYTPNKWPIDDSDAYEIAENEAFLNEKHFASIKLLVTKPLQNLILNHQIKHAEDAKRLIELLEKRISQLTMICKESEVLHEYLQTHRTNILQTLIYEINEFVKTNKHYKNIIPDDVLDNVIDSFNNVLTQIEEKPLSTDEIEAAKTFTKNIDSATNKRQVKEFYLQQKMYRYANLFDEKEINESCRLFMAEWKEQKDQLDLFLQKLHDQYKPHAIDPLLQLIRYTKKFHQVIFPELLNELAIAEKFSKLLTPEQKGILVRSLIEEKNFNLAKSILFQSSEIVFKKNKKPTQKRELELKAEDLDFNLIDVLFSKDFLSIKTTEIQESDKEYYLTEKKRRR